MFYPPLLVRRKADKHTLGSHPVALTERSQKEAIFQLGHPIPLN